MSNRWSTPELGCAEQCWVDVGMGMRSRKRRSSEGSTPSTLVGGSEIFVNASMRAGLIASSASEGALAACVRGQR